MRKAVVRSSNILLTLGGIGVLTITLGFLYFSGAGGVEGGLFYGFNFGILLAFGFYLSLVGLFPVLTSLDVSSKNTVRKFYAHLIILSVIGVILVIYSTLVPHTLAPLDPSHTWFDYYIFGAILIIFGLSPILLAIRDRKRIWKFRIILFLVFFVGILLEIVSLLIYLSKISDLPFEFLQDFVDQSMWINFFIIGGIITFFGMIPLLVTASSGFRGIIHRLRFIWILIALIGIITYFAPTLALNGIIFTEDIFDVIGYFEFLLFGGLAIAVGLLLISASDQAYDFIYKIRFIILLVLFIGTIQLIISFILVLPTSEFIDIPELEAIPLMTISTYPTTLGYFMFLGMTWNVLFFNGIVMSFIAIIFICSIVFFESEEVTVDIGALMAVEEDRLPGIETTPGEMLTYLEIVNRSQEEMLNYFKEAARQDRFRPRVFEAITKQYKDLNKLIKGKVSEYRKKAPSSAKGLFDAALSGVEVPSEPAVTPPVPTERVAPPPSAPPPSAPPPSVPPPTPSVTPSGPPIPSPTPAAPAPPPAPVPSDQSPLDLIADARSTSIAELRGEMLKELRRLREIFKEE
ncbi:MAG: hypothetical protein ACFE8U_06450 [Candidatus Hermodarchaeota archaeon]